jgi:hypothetical protein
LELVLAGGGHLRADTLWRVVAQSRIHASSSDHGQAFGLSKPVDSAARAVQALSNSVVRRASLAEDTGDVLIEFDTDARLEILTTSTKIFTFAPPPAEPISVLGFWVL